jgi:glycosyltransferase involved in cell wall biosynthesis
MLRFGELLTSDETKCSNFDIEEIFPTSVFTKISPCGNLRKWAAYIDKFLLFPNKLKRKLNKRKEPLHLIHIIDHSNAIYLPIINRMSRAKKIITCHDLIAIRTAKGDFAQAPKTSKSGIYLQNWISDSLHHADHYACDSRQTMNDLNQIIPMSSKKSTIIHLGTEIDSSLKSMNRTDPTNDLPFDPTPTNFLLHVGSAAWYKNRKAVFRSFLHAHRCLPEHDLKLVLVGPDPQKEELDKNLTTCLRLKQDSIYSIKDLSEKTLHFLYSNANIMVFPSFTEGFGWPPLEAASHCCPLISTRTGAIYDLLGNYCHYVDPNSQKIINQTVIELLKSNDRRKLNLELPTLDDCRRKYFKMYFSLIKN